MTYFRVYPQYWCCCNSINFVFQVAYTSFERQPAGESYLLNSTQQGPALKIVLGCLWTYASADFKYLRHL